MTRSVPPRTSVVANECRRTWVVASSSRPAAAARSDHACFTSRARSTDTVRSREERPTRCQQTHEEGFYADHNFQWALLGMEATR